MQRPYKGKWLLLPVVLIALLVSPSVFAKETTAGLLGMVFVLATRRSFEWFLGRNDLNLPVYDPTTGGCRDGLHPDRPNENQGAESTLAFLQTLLELRLAEEHPSAKRLA